MNDKVIGIIGGMGPEATAAFYMKIINATNALKDQDHFRVIIDSNPKIPDRTKAILNQGESPVPAIVQSGQNLQNMIVDILCIPCITSHYFLGEIQQHLTIPVMNALDELHKHIHNKYPNINSIGVLATTGTIKSGLFDQYFPDFTLLYPDDHSQNKLVMESIYGSEGIKQGNTDEKPLNLLKEAADELIQKGAQLIISGCTEIGIVLKSHHICKPIIDPMDIMACSVVGKYNTNNP